MCKHNENTRTLLDHRMEYLDYCKHDPYFKELREARWKMDNYECVMCGHRAQTIHHRRYPAVLGTETVHDVISICWACHNNYHSPPTLEESRRQVYEKSFEGIKCPVCDKHVQRYSRRLNKSMVLSLVWLVRFSREHPELEWIDVPTYAPRWLVKTNQLPTVAWWGLIERNDENVPEAKKHTGLWRPTKTGFAFFDGTIKANTHVYTYNGNVEGFSKNEFTLSEALGLPGFNYLEMMSEHVPCPDDLKDLPR